MEKILNLTLKRKWFDQIVAGTKKIEFRAIKPYWTSRIDGKQFDEVHFRNGYNQFSPFLRIKIVRIVKDGHYKIHLGDILEIKNYP